MILTFAPGTAAPVGSVTVPEMVPRSDCAKAVLTQSRKTIAAAVIVAAIFGYDMVETPCYASNGLEYIRPLLSHTR